MSDLRRAALAVVHAWDTDGPVSTMEDLRAALAQPDEKFCDANCVWTDHHPDCALAQPEPEPVAYRFQSPATEEWLLGLEPPAGSRWEIEPLYTAPPQCKPLTDQEIIEAIKHISHNEMSAFAIARAIERILK